MAARSQSVRLVGVRRAILCVGIGIAPLFSLAAQSGDAECYRPGGENPASIYAYLRYFEDVQGVVKNPTELRAAALRQLPHETVSLGFTDSTYCFVLCVRAEDHAATPDVNAAESADRTMALGLQNTFLEHVDIYLERDSAPATKVAELGLQSRVKQAWPLYVFRMTPGEQVRLYLRMHSRSPLRFSASLAPVTEFYRHEKSLDFLIGGMISAVLALAVFNLILYFQLRDRNYLLYFCFLVLVAGYRIFFHGLPVAILPEVARANYLMITLIVAEMSTFFVIRWMRVFLDLRTYSRHAYVVANVFAWSSVPACLIALYDPFLANQIIPVKAIVIIAFCIPVPLYVWRRGYRPALWFAIAFVMAPINLLMHLLSSYGVLPFDLFARMSIDITSLTQALLLSLALADRIRLSELGHRAQLESRVDERTRELREEVELRTAAQERAENATRAREAFLANMSHEIRTPMNAILGMADLLEETPLDATQKEYIHTFQRAGRKLQHLLNDVIDISKVDSGALPIRNEAFDLHALLDDLERIHGSAPRYAEVRLSFQRAPDLPRWIRGDSGRLSQIITNLLSNALKFTAHGEVTLTASLAPTTDADGEILSLAVRDTGAGLSEDELTRIFERFYQSDTTYARRTGGSGLGLAISRRLAELMGGELTAVSVPGQGSEFRLLFPCARCAPPGAAESLEKPGREAGRRSVRILGVDDSEDNRELLRHYFKKGEHEIDLAESGARAIALFSERPYEIVLMDIQMPEMDGFETTRRLREIMNGDSGRSSTRIVALTAYATEREVAAIREFGFDGYLQKPISRRDLLAAVDEMLATG